MLRSYAAIVFAVVAGCGDDSGDAASTTLDATTDGDVTSSTGLASDASGAATVADASGSSTGEGVLPYSGPLRVMTFNVLCSICDGTFDPWAERVPWIGDTITRHDPDLIGLQEFVFSSEVDDVLAVTPGYTAIFWGDDPRTQYPDATVLYRDSMFEPLEQGFYWLSPTPDTPKSTGFSGGFQLPRLVTWVVLRRLDDDAQLYFATTHFDNNSPSQELSAPLVLERIAPFIDELPVVMVGDFNARPGSEAYDILTGADGFVNAFDLAAQWSIDHNAAERPAYDTASRIDHVFLAGAPWTVPSWVVDLWTYGDNVLPVSDHWAITADLAL